MNLEISIDRLRGSHLVTCLVGNIVSFEESFVHRELYVQQTPGFGNASTEHLC